MWFKRVFEDELMDPKLEVGEFCVVEVIGLTKV